MRFRPGQHLRRAADFQHVRTVGRRFDCGAFMLWHAPRRTNQAQAEQPGASPRSLDATPLTAPTPAADNTPPPATETHANATLAPRLQHKEPVTLVAEKNPAPARAGFVASRAAVGGAIERNRAKRRLREAFRHQQHLAPAGHDLILVARAAAGRLALTELELRLAAACRKISPPAQ